MRTLAAATLLTVIGVVLTADPFYCADGCTDAPHSAVAAPSICALCQGATVPVAAAVPHPRQSHPISSDPALPNASPLMTGIDHPPRPLA